MKTRLICALALFSLARLATAQQEAYKDPKQPVDKRVDDLLSRMTLEEKASQLLSQSPAIERLAVPKYDWWNECLHGVARAGRATVFPEPVGMAASWDAPLLFRVATAISDEARAKNNEFVRRGKRGIYQGLTFWTPNINIFRDPRWGRGMETYGEDPYLTGSLAVQFIRGLEGDDPKYLKVVATAKHYAVHSGPESTRHTADVQVDEKDLRDTYLAQFEMAIKEGGAQSVMCAYNSIDGKPACANTRLLEDILRRQWKFPGYVVSDCGAVGDVYQGHKAAADALSGVAMAVKAGTDLDCGLEYQNVTASVKKGLMAESDVDTALRRLLTARFRLGMFDPPSMVSWAKIPYAVNESRPHQELALQMARESVVLLKNEGGILPLRKDLKTIAVIGPDADSEEVLLGNYNGQPQHAVTPLEGIKKKLAGKTQVLYAKGCDLAPGMPSFETIPSSVLFTSEGADRKPGLKGDYYATANFNGRAYLGEAFVSAAMRKAVPIPTDPKPLFTRIDPQIEFDWRDGAPRKDMDDDNFGVQWTGFLAPKASGKFQVGVTGLNSYELYLNNKRIASRDNVHERSYEYDTVELEAGKLYPLKLNFHEVHGDADIRLVWEPPHQREEEHALELARKADAIVMVMGLSPRLEGEEMKVQVDGFSGGDRVKLGIPQVQEDLLKQVANLGKPVVLVLLNGSAVAVNWAKDHLPGIVELWYPGQAGGTALADVLFGDYNPAGRLPVTFYQSESQLPPFEDYSMKGRTYRYFTGEPLFPFGYGLSYTNFHYGNLRLPAESATGNELRVSVEVQNAGRRMGDEVVELYVSHKGAGETTPIRSLARYQRISLAPGSKKTIAFMLDARALALAGADGGLTVQPGEIEIAVGGKQPGFSGPADAATTQVLVGRVQLKGTAQTVE